MPIPLNICAVALKLSALLIPATQKIAANTRRKGIIA
jgi:hypothetical protein